MCGLNICGNSLALGESGEILSQVNDSNLILVTDGWSLVQLPTDE